MKAIGGTPGLWRLAVHFGHVKYAKQEVRLHGINEMLQKALGTAVKDPNRRRADSVLKALSDAFLTIIDAVASFGGVRRPNETKRDEAS